MGKEGRERKGVLPAHFSDASAAYAYNVCKYCVPVPFFHFWP